MPFLARRLRAFSPTSLSLFFLPSVYPLRATHSAPLSVAPLHPTPTSPCHGLSPPLAQSERLPLSQRTRPLLLLAPSLSLGLGSPFVTLSPHPPELEDTRIQAHTLTRTPHATTRGITFLAPSVWTEEHCRRAALLPFLPSSQRHVRQVKPFTIHASLALLGRKGDEEVEWKAGREWRHRSALLFLSLSSLPSVHYALQLHLPLLQRSHLSHTSIPSPLRASWATPTSPAAPAVGGRLSAPATVLRWSLLRQQTAPAADRHSNLTPRGENSGDGRHSDESGAAHPLLSVPNEGSTTLSNWEEGSAR